MKQSHVYNEVSIALTTEILQAKASKKLSWQDLTDGTGLDLAYVTAALFGQQPLPEKAAKVIGEKLELDAEMVALLQVIPSRGSLASAPHYPTMNRFHDMIQVFDYTLKVMAREHLTAA
jgi:cyanate lyase